mmetsp:Transcript_29024/g.88978  ORF Transcript_29024/g.88978 Transcript_29024/m.88978 type:complete len:86 (-) Transcript_29024:10-267(-)
MMSLAKAAGRTPRLSFGDGARGKAARAPALHAGGTPPTPTFATILASSRDVYLCRIISVRPTFDTSCVGWRLEYRVACIVSMKNI